MSKQTRQEKREEEQKVLAQMEEAMQEEKQEKPAPKEEGEKKSRSSFYASTEPERVHCRRCKTLMENGVCPTCGFKMYVPMSEEKRKKIKMVATAIGFAVFIAIFLIIQFTKN